MRTVPPHRLVRYRHVLLALALAAWAVAGFVLLQFKGSSSIPVATIVALAALVFVWANGAFWWVMFRYPYIEMAKNQFANRDEWTGESHALLLGGYFLLAIFASVASVNVAVNG